MRTPSDLLHGLSNAFKCPFLPLGQNRLWKSQVPSVGHTSLLAFHLGPSLCLSSCFVWQTLFKNSELLHWPSVWCACFLMMNFSWSMWEGMSESMWRSQWVLPEHGGVCCYGNVGVNNVRGLSRVSSLGSYYFLYKINVMGGFFYNYLNILLCNQISDPGFSIWFHNGFQILIFSMNFLPVLVLQLIYWSTEECMVVSPCT